MVTVFYGFALSLLVATIVTSNGAVHAHCEADKLVRYQITMKTHWSRELFPRHYPEFRPPAQWSKLLGRSHGSGYEIFTMGEMASEGLRKFGETGSSDILDEFSQGTVGVFDAFNGPPITKGEGETESQFFADANHSMVSVVARIIPSPDWIVGIDSVNLCISNEWTETIKINTYPIDLGTDSGFTYTAPNYETLPKEAIHFIHEAKLHPAHSFYYVDRETNPPIATFVFRKLKEYSLFPEKGTEAFPGILDELATNDITQRIIRNAHSREGKLYQNLKKKRLRRRKKAARSKDCVVGEWLEWSECSAFCGVGEQKRSRHVIAQARGNGAPCPNLDETRLCSSFRDCRQKYFDW